MRSWIFWSPWLLLILAFFWASQGAGQTGNPPTSLGVLPPQAYLTDRDSNLERELRRLQDARAGMGINHPRIADVDKRIAELETELATFRAIPNPFEKFEDQGLRPQDIVERLSEQELRVLVIRLAVDVKDLRKRMAALEKLVQAP